MHFDLTDLRLFLHVVEEGSITAGAARAGLALASASARVRGMEEQAGVPLLERGRRGVVPTEAGRTLLRHARLVTGQVERMRGELGTYARGLKGHVRLLANTAAVAEFLPECLAAFLAANSNVDVELGERSSPEVARAVAEEEAQIGIAAGHADVTGLEVRPFRADRLVLIAPSGHPLAGRGRIAFAEALGGDFVGLADDSALGGHLAGHAARAGGRMRIRVRVRGLDTACRMVALGAGLAVVPEAAARRWHGQGALALVRLEDPWAERQLMVLVRRLEALPSHARRLAEHLAASAGAAPGR
ncbi:LysR substrate-binding domain-containing protein [Siccirubricoccus sp. KC 17139]|uniref:LysR substrate-binding domain-containing protein n=1 Tax=Siccirubricoccus soli TaxID=2899147 RepID=A0ABT1D108_9PROT|nr:LysR substrate-binding domain-containing protein [Siccirubricoccus soli]MCO6414720.1 LysR substrate-binding domain-containing protein [Siccirubricoccus soli]MCP2680850.1 LysR substrate-binding domain-containing protein [Siccirubricoccus soli]